MKQILSILLSLLLVISLTACGGGDEKDPTGGGSDAPLTREDNTPLTREDDPAPSTDIGGTGAGTQGSSFASGDLQSMVEGTNRNNLTPEAIAALEADAAQNGYEIEWQADGTMVILENGSALTFGGEWPDNELTKNVPAPTVGSIIAIDETEDGCMVMMNWTEAEAKEYAETLKDAGFNRGVLEQGLMGIYTWEGSNGEISVALTLMSGTGGIGISETDPEELAAAEAEAAANGGEAPGVTMEDLQGYLDGSRNDLQEQLDAMQNAEDSDIELPEGYDQYLEDYQGYLGEIDLGSLLGGLGGLGG